MAKMALGLVLLMWGDPAAAQGKQPGLYVETAPGLGLWIDTGFASDSGQAAVSQLFDSLGPAFLGRAAAGYRWTRWAVALEADVALAALERPVRMGLVGPAISMQLERFYCAAALGPSYRNGGVGTAMALHIGSPRWGASFLGVSGRSNGTDGLAAVGLGVWYRLNTGL